MLAITTVPSLMSTDVHSHHRHYRRHPQRCRYPIDSIAGKYWGYTTSTHQLIAHSSWLVIGRNKKPVYQAGLFKSFVVYGSSLLLAILSVIWIMTRRQVIDWLSDDVKGFLPQAICGMSFEVTIVFAILRSSFQAVSKKVCLIEPIVAAGIPRGHVIGLSPPIRYRRGHISRMRPDRYARLVQAAAPAKTSGLPDPWMISLLVLGITASSLLIRE